MSSTSKRPRSSNDEDDELINSTKRLNASQSTQPSIDDLSTIHTNGDDDPSLFELDLSMCPELGSVDDKMSDLNIGGSLPAVSEEGDDQQKAAILHATTGGNLFLTGKAG